MLDDAGRAITTHTEDVAETREEALVSARKVAAKNGLPIYENPENGPAVQIVAALE